ncbi:MAG: hypothetical protein OEZ38_11440 [Gammaproteobacteria bacterium]|nr:hypothetical protein [Gammaproteobacteria bacterium]
MFENIIKNSKTYKKLEKQHKEQSKKLVDLESINNEQSDKIKDLLSPGGYITEDGKSRLVFEFDEELNVTTKSIINKDVVPALVDNNYISPDSTEDEIILQLAFIVIANEVTEQIIEDVNENQNKLNS